MNDDIAIKLRAIKAWLGTGSINIFGLPMSGKDTVGVRLAESIQGKFLSSGLIIRSMELSENQNLTGGGRLIDTNLFYDWVLPYFSREELASFPLVLSSIGRWSGEEDRVMRIAKASGHEIKAAIILNVSEADVTKRWQAVQSSVTAADRGARQDDSSPEIFEIRLKEFREKTLPVVLHYRQLGLLVEVKANMDKDSVFYELVNRLYDFSQRKIMEARNLRPEERFF